MQRRPSEGLTIRAALVLGFGLTLSLWFFAGYQFTRRMSDTQKDISGINQRYQRAQARLTTVRTQILLGSVIVRDALLDPNPKTTESYTRRLEASYALADDALKKYVPLLGDSRAELERVLLLQTEMASFRATMLDLLASDQSQWATQAGQLLRNRVLPKQDVVVRISEEVQELNRSAFIDKQNASAEVYGATEQQVWRQLGLAVLGSLGIAVFASLYAGGLEKRLRIQRDRNEQNSRDLQRLSAEIVRVQEEERRSIARELHDEVGQVLTAIKVELASAQRAIESSGGSPHLLTNARAIADGAFHTVRDLSHLLHPALLDDLGLAAAVDRQLREFGTRHGIRVELNDDRLVERLPPDTESAAYRVIQEALTNVAKHASATTCRVYLRRLPAALQLIVEDDGVGFSPGDHTRNGLGLIGIRERVARLQGIIRLDSAPGEGTRLIVELPAPQQHPEPADAVLAANLRPAAATSRFV